MLRKLYGIAGFLSLAGMLALGGLAGYLGFGGKLTSANIDAIAAVMRGELSLADKHDAAPASQPATQPSDRANSAEQLAKQRRDDQLRRAVLEAAKRDALAQRELLSQAMQELITREESFAAAKKTWKKERDRLQDDLQDEGFKKELTFVSKLAPRQAKDHLLKTWNKSKADAIRLINALKPSAVSEIFEQFKTAAEMETLHELLEQLRSQDVAELAGGSGKTAADASP